jgi:transposase
MGKQKYENEFKVMIVELLNSGIKTSQVSTDYGLNVSMLSRWRREHFAKSGDFSKKKEVSLEAQELKALKKELRDIKEERDILKKAVSIFSKSDR